MCEQTIYTECEICGVKIDSIPEIDHGLCEECAIKKFK